MEIKHSYSCQTIIFVISLFIFTHFSITIVAPAVSQKKTPVPSSEDILEIQPFQWDSGITVYSDQKIVFKIGWLACQKGLVQDYIKAANLTLTRDGESLFASKADAEQYWGPITEKIAGSSGDTCLGKPSDTLWQVAWEYPYGHLEAGDYTFYISSRLERTITDGFDANGDGVPDKYNGTLKEREFTIHVEDRP